MYTVSLSVEESKIASVVEVIEELKKSLIREYRVLPKESDICDFDKLSEASFAQIWDNEEDSEYDKFLKI